MRFRTVINIWLYTRSFVLGISRPSPLAIAIGESWLEKFVREGPLLGQGNFYGL